MTITADLATGMTAGRGARAGAARSREEVLPEAPGYRFVFSGESEKFFESGNALLFAYCLAMRGRLPGARRRSSRASCTR